MSQIPVVGIGVWTRGIDGLTVSHNYYRAYKDLQPVCDSNAEVVGLAVVGGKQTK
jgi:hypothetical protein